jgi:hypothetical protein
MPLSAGGHKGVHPLVQKPQHLLGIAAPAIHPFVHAFFVRASENPFLTAIFRQDELGIAWFPDKLNRIFVFFCLGDRVLSCDLLVTDKAHPLSWKTEHNRWILVHQPTIRVRPA